MSEVVHDEREKILSSTAMKGTNRAQRMSRVFVLNEAITVCSTRNNSNNNNAYERQHNTYASTNLNLVAATRRATNLAMLEMMVLVDWSLCRS
jgi:hypothetical protein